MKSFLLASLLLLAFQSYAQDFLAPAFKVASMEFNDFKDASRDNRPVPMKVYYPENLKGPLPTIIFSHGLGGSMEGYEYLGSYWAARGMLCVHVQHKGSDSELIKGGPLRSVIGAKKALMNLDNALDRPKDVSFAIDKILELSANDHILKGLADPNAIGVAGHSFGAFTALASAGMRVGGKKDLSDKRVKAAIEMSAPGKTRAKDAEEEVYSSIAIPMMHFTGTEDKATIIGLADDPKDRLIPFQRIKAPNQYLIVFDGGEHMLFSGRVRKGKSETPEEAKRHELIQRACAAFWFAFLKGDKQALEYLNSESGLKAALAAEASLERK